MVQDPFEMRKLYYFLHSKSKSLFEGLHKMKHSYVITLHKMISSWVSPLVLIPKINGKPRFCVNLIKLNTVTYTNAYPLPTIQELLDLVAGSFFPCHGPQQWLLAAADGGEQ